ncbi:hypothetical protein HMPREF9554_00818 [Treponema phagedenis F0421]|nr:hypothetical protein HMPREF9554_00818 [Treponema phagedenis F0421]
MICRKRLAGLCVALRAWAALNLPSGRCLKASIQIYQSEPPWTAVVPSRSDVLKA